jgi:fatty acid desaturase
MDEEIKESLKRIEAKIDESSRIAALLGLIFLAGSIIVASVSMPADWGRFAWMALAVAMTLVAEVMLWWKPWRKKK